MTNRQGAGQGRRKRTSIGFFLFESAAVTGGQMGPHPVRDILVESVCLDTYFGLLALVRISGWAGL